MGNFEKWMVEIEETINLIKQQIQDLKERIDLIEDNISSKNCSNS